ncbi:hypothetical protein ACHAWF_007283 [Thalassiosira exigua]
MVCGKAPSLPPGKSSSFGSKAFWFPMSQPVPTAQGEFVAVDETMMARNSSDAANYDAIYCKCDNIATAGASGAMIDDLFTSLLHKVRLYNPQAVVEPWLASGNETNQTNVPILRHAYEYARAAHEGQCRRSGEPYITHPLGVAHVVADLKLDLPSLLTALLHDTVEDTHVTLDDISRDFGDLAAQLVDGVTKVGKIPRTWSYEERQSENYRKLILSTSRDVRVLLVKLADRAHNMRTLEHMPVDKRRRIARETMELYAPLAHRLGMYALKSELEDMSFKFLHPDRFQALDRKVRGSTAERKRYEEEVVGVLTSQMRDAGVGGKNGTLLVTGRTKGLHSIDSKMRRQAIEFDEVRDVIGFRIIVDDVASCYQALGVVHSHFKPVPGKIKDYVALPKPNGYQSLHTTVVGPNGKQIEIQIRTREMHEIAEAGIAAHWMYKQGGTSAKDGARFAWLRELVQEVRRQSDPKEFVKLVKEDLFPREVFVFTPNGDLHALARGSSVLDFAFKVHSHLGSHCVGAKVNGKLVSIRHLVENGDTVEILTRGDQTPKREWLKHVRTSKAKTRIRSWLKRRERERSITAGRKMVEEGWLKYRGEDGKKEYQRKMSHLLTTFKLKDETDLLRALGHGQLTVESVMTEIFGSAAIKTHGNRNKREKEDEFVLTKQSTLNVNGYHETSDMGKGSGILVGRERNILLRFCKNCSPLKGERVKGVVTKGLGVKVHREECRYLQEANDDRIVDVRWDDTASISPRPVRLHVMCEDAPGVLANMSRTITSLGVNIGNVNLRRLRNGKGLAWLEVMVGTLEEIEMVMDHLRKEDGIISVSRP